MELIICFTSGFICATLICILMVFFLKGSKNEIKTPKIFKHNPIKRGKINPSKKSVIVLDNKHDEEMEEE